MSTYAATSITLPTTAFGGRRFPPVTATLLVGAAAAVTTYHYLTVEGVRSSATSEDDIPAGAVVMFVS